jgi:aminoglycoside/choline kinase family phosphotransferase
MNAFFEARRIAYAQRMARTAGLFARLPHPEAK